MIAGQTRVCFGLVYVVLFRVCLGFHDQSALCLRSRPRRHASLRAFPSGPPPASRPGTPRSSARSRPPGSRRAAGHSPRRGGMPGAVAEVPYGKPPVWQARSTENSDGMKMRDIMWRNNTLMSRSSQYSSRYIPWFDETLKNVKQFRAIMRPTLVNVESIQISNTKSW